MLPGRVGQRDELCKSGEQLLSNVRMKMSNDTSHTPGTHVLELERRRALIRANTPTVHTSRDGMMGVGH